MCRNDIMYMYMLCLTHRCYTDLGWVQKRTIRNKNFHLLSGIVRNNTYCTKPEYTIEILLQQI